MEKSRTAKYFKYAIGEIFLVVIGILIALQINNWNQENIDRKYEIFMLKETGSSLVADIQNLKSTLDYLETVQKSARALAIMQDDNDHSQESLNYHFDMVRGSDVRVKFNSSPYQSIKSNGLNKISNAKLRSDLALLYEILLRSAEVEINENIGEQLNDRDDFLRNVFEVKTKPDSTNGITTEFVINHEMISNDPDFDKFLSLSGGFIPQAKWIMNKTIDQMEKVKAEIDAELKE
jgi:hypothetical protein